MVDNVNYTIIPYSERCNGTRFDQVIIDYNNIEQNFIDTVIYPMLKNTVPGDYKIINWQNLDIVNKVHDDFNQFCINKQKEDEEIKWCTYKDFV